MPKNESQELYTIVRQAQDEWGNEVIKDLVSKKESENIFTYKIILDNKKVLNVMWYMDNNEDPPKKSSLVTTNNQTHTYYHSTDNIYEALHMFRKQAPMLGVGIDKVVSDHTASSTLTVSCKSRFLGIITASLQRTILSRLREDMLDPQADYYKSTFRIKFNKDILQLVDEEIRPMLRLLKQELQIYGYESDTSTNVLRPHTPTGNKYMSVYHIVGGQGPVKLGTDIMDILCVATTDV